MPLWKAPVIIWAAVFVVIALLMPYTQLSSWAVLPAVGLVGLGAVARRRLPRPATAFVSGVGMAIVICLWHAADAPATHPAARWLGEGQRDALLSVLVIDGPRTRDGGSTYVVDVRAVDKKSFDEPARMRLFAPESLPTDLRPGDVADVFGTVERFAPRAFPERRSSRAFYEGRGFTGRIRLRDVPEHRGVDRTPTTLVRRLLTVHRLDFERRLTRHLSGESLGLARGLLVGERSGISAPTRDVFVATGTAHLLAISGLHFGVIAGLVWLLAGFVAGFFPRLLDRWGRRRICGGAVLLFLGLYVVWIGAPTSAVRAWAAASAVVIALLTLRHFCAFHALAAAVVGLISWRPAIAAEIGFQLSFAATTGILLVLHLRGDRFDTTWRPRKHHAVRAVREYLLVSTAATLSTWPVLLAHFGEISPVALLANPLVVPVVSMLLFPLLVAGAVIQYVVPVAGATLLELATEMLLLLCDGLAVLADLPLSTWCPGLPSTVAVAGLATGAVLLILARRNWRLAVVALAIVVPIVWALEIDRRAPPSATAVHFIPVGQGDATLLELETGERILIDAGGVRRGSDPGRRVVIPYLKRLGITHLDAIIVTHSDIDHVGGMEAVMNLLTVDALVYDAEDDNRLLHRLVERARRTIPVSHRPVELTPDFRVFRPDPPVGGRNDRSLVGVVDVDGVRMLLPGDLEWIGERWLLEHEPDVRAAILKIPHHGSKTSSSLPFLDAVRPVVAVASAGRHSRFGHPHEIVMLRHLSRGVTPLSTAGNGLVRVTIRDDGAIAVMHVR